MLSLAQLGKVVGRDRSGKAKVRGELSLPLAHDFAALGPVILFLGRELFPVITQGLTRGKRLGDQQRRSTGIGLASFSILKPRPESNTAGNTAVVE
jgi:hypothetical protein